MGVPYTFASATNSIPLSQLDANFNTPVTIGSTTVGLGNTTTTLAGLANVSTTALTVTNDASISGLTVGKGGGSISTNTAVGSSALGANTTGLRTVAIGANSLFNNTTGNSNISIGYNAMYTNSSGQSNTAIGSNYNYAAALQANTTGSFNAAVGEGALGANTTGSYNTAQGIQALTSNTTASNNTAVGYQAGYSNTGTSNNNVFIGYQAGYTFNGVAGTGNTFVGNQAGYSVTTGTGNTFVGPTAGAGYYVTTGSKNTIIGGYNGNQGGLDIRTASNYIVLSDGDGNPRGVFDNNGSFLVNSPISAPTSGSATFGGQVYIGSRYYNFTSSDFALTVAYGTTITQGISFGTNATSGTQTAARFIQNSSVVGSIQTTNTATAFNTSSDYRLKENVAPMVGALDKVIQLKPCTYTWKIDGSDGQGFIAHELQEVCPEAVTGTKDQVNEDGSIKPQGIDTSFLVATLTAAIQEQQALITDLQARLTKAGL